MKIKFLLVVFLLTCPLAEAASGGFEPGDFMFISGRIIGCDHRVRLVEFGEVEDTGDVTLFDSITFNVQDKSVSEVTIMLLDALEQRSGYRSQAVRILRTPKEDAKSRATLLMQIYGDRKANCAESELPDIYQEQGQEHKHRLA